MSKCIICEFEKDLHHGHEFFNIQEVNVCEICAREIKFKLDSLPGGPTYYKNDDREKRDNMLLELKKLQEPIKSDWGIPVDDVFNNDKNNTPGK